METLNGKKTKGFITQISHWSDFLTDKRVGWLLRGGAWVKDAKDGFRKLCCVSSGQFLFCSHINGLSVKKHTK